jgi:hypothetical protein
LKGLSMLKPNAQPNLWICGAIAVSVFLAMIAIRLLK